MSQDTPFAGLDLKLLIGGPLSAAADGQMHLAQEAAAFLSATGELPLSAATAVPPVHPGETPPEE